MKTLTGLAALSLSLILGLAPFALIAVNDLAAGKAGVSTAVAAHWEHAPGFEGR